MTYDAAGNLLSTIDPLDHTNSITYGDSFSDGNNHNTFAYPTSATINDPTAITSYVQYNFDFGAKTRVQGPPPAGQSQGAIQTITYDAALRLKQATTVNTGA